jgi:hypothetical protein
VLTLGVSLIAAAAGALADTDCGAPPPPAATDGDSQSTGFTLGATQRANAQIIYNVGAQLHIPHRGEVIAIATALQESHLINLTTATDHDSLGLFQQRPSAGWGRPDQILDPVYAATAFYRHLVRIPRWEKLALTVAAQAVQRSALPGAYAKWEGLATAIAGDAAKAIGRTIDDATTCEPDCPTATDSSTTPGPVCEWVAPVHAPVVSRFRTADRPGHDGADLASIRGSNRSVMVSKAAWK